MFYSHQLLAPKAPLGLIWLAATKQERLGRQNLVKLNLSKICELIQNPPVPLALRISGILMGGVATIYSEKVDLLYRDVHQLQHEFDKARRYAKIPDQTRLPKGKSNAHASDTIDTMGFHNLDKVEVSCLNINDQEHDHHQVDAATITLDDGKMAATSTFNLFERFDEEGHEGTEVLPSPSHPVDLDRDIRVPTSHQQESLKLQSRIQPDLKEGSAPKRARRRGSSMQYDEVTVIPDEEYETWQDDSSDLVRNFENPPFDALSTMRISTRIELPSIVLMENLFTYGDGRVYFPAALRCDHPATIGSTRAATEVNSFHGRGSPSVEAATEKQRENVASFDEVPDEIRTHERPSRKRLFSTLQLEATTAREEILSQFKTRTRGNPRVVSLDGLARGKDKTSATSMFFQTCVLASRGQIKVNQEVAYGDIKLQRGPNL